MVSRAELTFLKCSLQLGSTLYLNWSPSVGFIRIFLSGINQILKKEVLDAPLEKFIFKTKIVRLSGMNRVYVKSIVSYFLSHIEYEISLFQFVTILA